jgi:hypothetical protein
MSLVNISDRRPARGGLFAPYILPSRLFCPQATVEGVLFLALHDWVPLGRFSNVKAVREANPGGKVLLASVISTAPYAFALAASPYYWDKRFPVWLSIYLWVTYTFLFVGELEAWWFPYFFGWKPERAASCQAMFGETHSFLPERHGIIPNTLHVILHLSTVALLAVLAVLTL